MEADVPLRQKSNNHKLCGDARQQGQSVQPNWIMLKF